MRTPLIFVLTLLLTTACGWQLRGAQTTAESLPRVRIASENSYAPMVRTLRELVEKQDNSDSSAPLYKLQMLEEKVDKRPVTYTANGTPAQYEMTITVRYAIQHEDSPGDALPRTAAAHRIFDFDPRNVVAKSEEERALLQDMRKQLARRIINEISRQYDSHLGRANTLDDEQPQ